MNAQRATGTSPAATTETPPGAAAIVVLDGHTFAPVDNPWDEVAALGNLTVYPRTPRHLVIGRSGDADILLTNKTVLEVRDRLMRATAANIRAAYARSVEVSVYAAREWRRREIGGMLLQSLIDAASEHGHHALLARISADIRRASSCTRRRASSWRAP